MTSIFDVKSLDRPSDLNESEIAPYLRAIFLIIFESVLTTILSNILDLIA